MKELCPAVFHQLKQTIYDFSTQQIIGLHKLYCHMFYFYKVITETLIAHRILFLMIIIYLLRTSYCMGM